MNYVMVHGREGRRWLINRRARGGGVYLSLQSRPTRSSFQCFTLSSRLPTQPNRARRGAVASSTPASIVDCFACDATVCNPAPAAAPSATVAFIRPDRLKATRIISHLISRLLMSHHQPNPRLWSPPPLPLICRLRRDRLLLPRPSQRPCPAMNPSIH